MAAPHKEALQVNDFFVVHMKEGCRGVLKDHIFSTASDLSVTYNVKYEVLDMDLKELFQGLNAEESEIAAFIAEEEDYDKPIRVEDVIKKFGIHALRRDGKINQMITFTAVGIGACVFTIGICWCVRRRYMTDRKSVDHTPNLYLSMNTVSTETADSTNSLVSKQPTAQRVARITRTS